MTYPIVRIVSAPEVDAEVRFDFNTAGEWSDDETWAQRDGFSLGAPTLEGDPDAYGVQYGLRQLEFNVIVSGTYSDASRLWSQLAKELVTRRTNWLMFRFSPTSPPVWFKTYRTAPEALDFEHIYDTDDAATNLWGLGVQLAAEPFAYGERVTLPTLTVTNNPAAATNPCMAVLPEILGDAPAPARYELSASAVHDLPSPMFSVTPVPDSFTGPIVLPIGTGDAATVFTDTGAPVASANASGGSYRPVSFATISTMFRRLSIPVSGITPGRYAVLLRVGQTASTSGMYSFRAVIGGRVYGDIVSMNRPPSPSGNYSQWFDLGTFAFPNGLTDWDAATGLTTTIAIFASRDAGSGDAALDSIVLMPVELLDGEPGMRMTTLLDSLGDTASGYVTRWDGDAEYVQAYRNGAATPGIPALPAGQFPTLTPGRRNVFHLFRQTDSAALQDDVTGDQRAATVNTDTIAMTTQVTISYHPRHLWLAP